MKEKTSELYRANSDVIALLELIKDIGWDGAKEASIHRILYMSSAFYLFLNEDQNNIFSDYHFSVSPSGPFSNLVSNSIIDLKARGLLAESEVGLIYIDNKVLKESNVPASEKENWLKIIVYLLGLYGESKIYGFIIQDPQYKDSYKRNVQKELDTSSSNKTLKTLKEFQNAFETTLDDVSEISHQEYLELYLEYIFSKIIKLKAD